MSRSPFIVINGNTYRWKDIVELRQAQVAAAASSATQLALFPALRNDNRPANARTASDRYQQPTLFAGDFPSPATSCS